MSQNVLRLCVDLLFASVMKALVHTGAVSNVMSASLCSKLHLTAKATDRKNQYNRGLGIVRTRRNPLRTDEVEKHNAALDIISRERRHVQPHRWPNEDERDEIMTTLR